MRGPSIDDVLAVLWGVCGLGIAGYFVRLGLQNRDMGASGLPLLVLAGVVLVGFTTVAVRHRRRAREERAARHSGPVGGWRVGPRPPRRPDRRRAPAPVAGPPPDPPELSASGRAALAHVVGVANRAGLFAPRAPRPVDLVEAVAVAGEPVTLEVVLAAIGEAASWHPGFRARDHLAALAFHDAHGEQLPGTLAAQVADLDRVAGDALDVRLREVDLTDEGRAARTRLRLALGDEERTLDYRGDPWQLSTVVHVEVARALRAAAPEGPWLAWTWSDRGVWLAALRPAVLEPLNRELGRALEGPWRWVDEEEPVAAGDMRGTR